LTKLIEVGSAVAGEDCITFDPTTAQVIYDPKPNVWVVSASGTDLVGFAVKADAQRALSIIQQYGLNSQCFVGRKTDGYPAAPTIMVYWKVNGNAPTGSISNPGDCGAPFKPQDVTAVQLPAGNWVVTAGTTPLLNFGIAANAEANAQLALSIIQQYKFTSQCFVGNKGPPAEMMYLTS
jgi:hypothetical protein